MKTQSGAKTRAMMGFLVALLTLALITPRTLTTPSVAHAAPAGCSVSGEAYGTQTTGNALVTSGKTADVILPPGGTNSVANTTSPTVSTGPITDTSLDVSMPTLATAATTSTVNGVSILAGAVTGSFQSVSTSSSDGATASTSSAGTYQSYSINNGPTQMNPAPNTRVDVPGVGFAIVNEQIPTGNSNGTTTTGLTVIGFDLHVVTGTVAVPAGTEIFIASAASGVTCSGLLAPLATATAAAQTASAGATQTAAAQTAAAQTAAAQTAAAQTTAAQTAAAQTAAALTANAGAAQTAAAQTAAAQTAAAQTAAVQTAGAQTAAAQTANAGGVNAGATQTAAAQTAAAQTANAGAAQTAVAQTAAAQTAAAQTANAGNAAAQTAAAQTAAAGAAGSGAAQTAATPTANAGNTGTGGSANTAVPVATSTPAPGNANSAATATTSPAQAAATGTARTSTNATVTPGQTGPRLTLQPPSARPGGAVTVTGTGFGRRERVTLSLNGAALTSVVANPDGTFKATFRAPEGLLNGANTVAASGAASGRSAVATLTGRQSVATTFYAVGASTMAGERASLPILNPNAQAARVDLTFYYRDGAPRQARLSVAAHSRGIADLNALAGRNRVFGLKLVANRVVTAQLDVARDGKDDYSLLGVSAPSASWYLAEGYTGLTFHETLALLNPGRTTARVQVRLLPFGGRAARTVMVTVAPQRTGLIDVNRLMPGRSLSIIATGRTPIVLTRLLTFSTQGYGVTARTGANTAATSWIFAEGTTTTRFQTFLTVLNPNRTGTQVTARFYGRTGALLGRRTIYVPGLRRANIKLNDVLHASGIASVVTSAQPIVVERPEYFGSPNGRRIAGSDVFGRNGAGLRWAFPGGTTTGRSEFLLIYNPSARTAIVDATGYGANGRMMTRRFSVRPTTRATVDVNRSFAGLAAQHGIVLRAANGQGFVAEQTLFAPNFSTLDSTQGAAS